MEAAAAGGGVMLYVGGHGTRIAGAVLDLHGRRCLSAAHRPFGGPGTVLHGRLDPARLHVLLDSGAFTDAPEQRLTPTAALERQLAFEAAAVRRWEQPWQVEALAAYDRLIDEKWVNGRRLKARWSVREATTAVEETVRAARYLASQRDRLGERRLVLCVQGVDADQYAECAAGVLSVAQPQDWIGLGGWCILGRFQRWLPTFWGAMRRTLPVVAAKGVTRVHLFGCLWPPALGGLLWLADQHRLTVSADSARPLMDVARNDGWKAGRKGDTWQESVAYWERTLATLRETRFYREPPSRFARQLDLFDVEVIP